MSLLFEESGVNKECQRMAKDFIQYFADFLSRKKVNYYQLKISPSGPIVYASDVSFPLNKLPLDFSTLNGTLKSIEVHLYCADEKIIRKESEFFLSRSSFYNRKNKQLHIVIIGIVGDEDIRYALSFAENIMCHELVHAFQMQFGKGVKTGKFYHKALAAYRNMTEDDNIREICYSIYYTAPGEITATCNQIYHSLCKQNAKNMEEVLQNLEYNKCLNILNRGEQAVSVVQENGDLINRLEKLLNTKFSTIKQTLLVNMQVMRNKVDKAVSYYLYEVKDDERLINETTFDPKYFDEREKLRKELFEIF